MYAYAAHDGMYIKIHWTDWLQLFYNFGSLGTVKFTADMYTNNRC